MVSVAGGHASRTVFGHDVGRVRRNGMWNAVVGCAAGLIVVVLMIDGLRIAICWLKAVWRRNHAPSPSVH